MIVYPAYLIENATDSRGRFGANAAVGRQGRPGGLPPSVRAGRSDPVRDLQPDPAGPQRRRGRLSGGDVADLAKILSVRPRQRRRDELDGDGGAPRRAGPAAGAPEGAAVADRRECRGLGRGAVASGAARSRPRAGPAQMPWSAGTKLPDDRVLLAYYYGLSYEELAEHCAVPVGTIKTWIHRAVEKLQSMSEPVKPGPGEAAEYVLGLLGKEDRRAFAQRLGSDAALQAQVAYWEEHAFRAFRRQQAEPMPAGMFEKILGRIEGEGADLPGTLTDRAGTANWFEISPGIKGRLLHVDRAQTAASADPDVARRVLSSAFARFRRADAGARGRHLRSATCNLKAGDFHVATPSSSHPPGRTVNGCLVHVIMSIDQH